jgi:hypothetical protein
VAVPDNVLPQSAPGSTTPTTGTAYELLTPKRRPNIIIDAMDITFHLIIASSLSLL